MKPIKQATHRDLRCGTLAFHIYKFYVIVLFVYNTREILGQIQGVFHILAFLYTENLQTQNNNGIRHYVAAPGDKFDFGFGLDPLGV
jgi:hypothetical protein